MLFPKGTVLFPKRGGAIGTNKKRIASKTVCADLNTMGVIPSDKIRPLYLYYYFQNIDFGTLYNGSSVPQINNTDIAPMEINLIPLEEQDDTVALLEKTDEIVRKRKEELQLLDDLIRARFVEMFGDPVTNPHNVPVATLGELSELITKGASPSWQGFSYTEDSSQTLFVTSENVREGYIDLSSPKYIEDGFNEKQKRSVIHKGDFLINIVGASIGRAAQFNLECKANMNQAAALVRPLINDFLRKMAKFQPMANQDVSAGTRMRFFIVKPAAMISFPRAVIKYL